MESLQAFGARVLARTGMDLATLPDVPAEALLEGQILARRGGCYVVTVGYPVSEDPESGWQTFDSFGVVGRESLTR